MSRSPTSLPRPPRRAERAPTPEDGEGRPLVDLARELLWLHGQLSRADIARLLDVSRSTASEIATDLLATDLVIEVGEGPSSGGRRPMMLEFQDGARVILGVDMGAAHVSVALTDLRGRVLDWAARDHPVRTDPDGTKRLIEALCDEVLDDVDAPLLGIGLAVPSPVDPERPDTLSPVVLPAWREQPGFEFLRDRFDVPVLIDNDANLGALAEYWWGGGAGQDELAFIKVATGIGSGHIIRGEIHRGATGVAGEMGHVAIDPGGAVCMCGNRGCLGTLVGSQALVERAEALLPEFPQSALAGGRPTIEAIEEAALADDPLAIRVVAEAGHHLGIAISGMLNLLNPSVVILGGRLTRLGPRLLEPIRDIVAKRTLVSSVAATRILTSDLGPQVVALGASTLVLQEALEHPTRFRRFAA